MFVYPLLKLLSPAAFVGFANLVTYVSFYAYTNTQNSNRNLRIKNQFLDVKRNVFNQLFIDRDSLMESRHSEIVNFLSNSKNQESLIKLGENTLIEQWKKVAPKNGEKILRDEGQKTNFFQEVRYFCASQQNTEDKEMIIIVSKLCSKKVITEKDFILPEERKNG